MKGEQEHKHRALEQWCVEEFAKVAETQKQTAAKISEVGEEVKAAKEEARAEAEQLRVQQTGQSSNVELILKEMRELTARLPPQVVRKRTSEEVTGGAAKPAATGKMADD